MDPENAYSKLIKLMKSTTPELEDKDRIIENVMGRIRTENKREAHLMILLDVMFGWVHVLWLRRAMAVTAIGLIIFFLGQQFFLMHRVKNLERQIITSVQSESVIEEGPGLKQQFLMKLMMDRPIDGDSITISREAFEALLRAYVSDPSNNGMDDPFIPDHPLFRNYLKKNMHPPAGKIDHQSNL